MVTAAEDVVVLVVMVTVVEDVAVLVVAVIVVEKSQVLVSGLPSDVLEDRLGNQADIPRLGHALEEDLPHGSQLFLSRLDT